jgi:hypothetical protein
MLARRGQRVLFYDTVEEEFGTGRVEREPFLEDYGTWGEKLAWALRQFLEGR